MSAIGNVNRLTSESLHSSRASNPSLVLSVHNMGGGSSKEKSKQQLQYYRGGGVVGNGSNDGGTFQSILRSSLPITFLQELVPLILRYSITPQLLVMTHITPLSWSWYTLATTRSARSSKRHNDGAQQVNDHTHGNNANQWLGDDFKWLINDPKTIPKAGYALRPYLIGVMNGSLPPNGGGSVIIIIRLSMALAAHRTISSFVWEPPTCGVVSSFLTYSTPPYIGNGGLKSGYQFADMYRYDLMDHTWTSPKRVPMLKGFERAQSAVVGKSNNFAPFHTNPIQPLVNSLINLCGTHS
jgi:hypothetical protein